MSYLHTADYVVIFIYFVLLVAVGLYLRKMAATSLEDYFLGGRRLPWWALGTSGTASFLDITGTMVITSFLFMLGPRGLYIAFRGGVALVLAFMLAFTGKWHRRSNVITGAEWQIFRYGKGAGGQFARLASVTAVTVATITLLAYMIKGVGLFLSMYLPFSPTLCAVILITVATIYTMASGFYGVVFTDLLQTAIILVAVVLITALAIQAVSNFDGNLADLAAEVVPNGENWTNCIPTWKNTMPEGYGDYSYLVMFAFFYLIKNVMNGLGSGGDPKFFGARNERECGKLVFTWTSLLTLRWPLMMGFAILGVFLVKEKFPDQTVLSDSAQVLKQYFVQREYPDDPDALNDPEIVEKVVPKKDWDDRVAGIINSPEKHPEAAAELRRLLGPEEWKNKLPLVGYEGWVNPERILPAVLLFCIPGGFRGLLLVALIAASMSTFDSTVNMATGFFTRDLYQAHFRREAGNRELIYASYVWGVVLVIGAFLVASTTKSITDIFDWFIMGLGSGLAMPGLLRMYWWRFNPGGVIGGLSIGLPAAISQRFLFPELTAVQQFLILTPISLAGAMIGTYLGKPVNSKDLQRFYKTTRPFGLWGPLKKALHPKVREKMTREHRNDLIAIPFIMGWQITLFLSPLLLLVRNFQAFWVVLGLFALCLLGMYKFWYRNLPPEREGVPTEEEIDAGNI